MDSDDNEKKPHFFFCGANILRDIDVDERVPFIFKNRIGDLVDDSSLNKKTISAIAADLKIAPSRVASIMRRSIWAIRRNICRGIEARKLPSSVSTKDFFISLLQKNPVDILSLDVRSANCIKNEGIETIYELVTKSQKEMIGWPNFGHASLSAVNQALDPYDLYIGMNPDLLDPEKWILPTDAIYKERLDASIPERSLDQAKKYRDIVKTYGEKNMSLLLEGSGVILPIEKIEKIKVKESV